MDFFKSATSLSLFASFLELARLQLKWDFWGGREEKGGEVEEGVGFKVGHFSVGGAIGCSWYVCANVRTWKDE